MLSWPQYTRPPDFRGMAVPEVLLSGDHERIAAWRREQACERTRARRPDLLSNESRSEEK
jgi:tRNA (guanine37-N1)-methyltransferase